MNPENDLPTKNEPFSLAESKTQHRGPIEKTLHGSTIVDLVPLFVKSELRQTRKGVFAVPAKNPFLPETSHISLKPSHVEENPFKNFPLLNSAWVSQTTFLGILAENSPPHAEFEF